jgi:hypothetical protein
MPILAGARMMISGSSTSGLVMTRTQYRGQSFLGPRVEKLGPVEWPHAITLEFRPAANYPIFPEGPRRAADAVAAKQVFGRFATL